MSEPTFGNGMPLGELDVTGSEADVAARYARGFFLIHGADLLSSSSDDTVATVTANKPQPLAGGRAAVFVVRRSPHAHFEFISVGRNRQNDVHLPHPTVSRFHAYLKEVDEGFLLQDAKSSYGTHVGLERVPRQGEGDPVLLRSGADVRFGDIQAVFLDVPSLITVVQGEQASRDPT